MKNIHIIGIAIGVVIILVLLLVTNALRTSPSPSTQSGTPAGQPSQTSFRNILSNPNIPTPFEEKHPVDRFTFEGLEFTIPQSWSAKASPKAKTVLIQPVETKSEFQLPRLQLSVLNQDEYKQLQESSRNRTPDTTISRNNQLVSEAYRDLHPGYINPETGETETIQERLAIVRDGNTYYSVYLQYAGTGRNEVIEDFFASFIESLAFQ